MKLRKFITLAFEKEDADYLIKVLKPGLLNRNKMKLALDEVYRIAETADVDPVDLVISLVERRCRNCGCTQSDCSQCIEKTGQPCHWVSEDLCSACQ